MSHEQEPTVELVTTRTAFEADSIAAALKERGVDARVFDNSGPMVAGGMLPGGVKVMVLAGDEAAARRALEEVKSESSSIDWDAVDVGDPAEGEKLTNAAKTRRWMWTLVALLVPAGLFILARGVDRGDAMLKTTGGTLLLAAVVLGGYLLGGERRK